MPRPRKDTSEERQAWLRARLASSENRRALPSWTRQELADSLKCHPDTVTRRWGHLATLDIGGGGRRYLRWHEAVACRILTGVEFPAPTQGNGGSVC